MGDKFKCIREFAAGYPFLGKMVLLCLFRPLFGVSAFCKTLLPSAPPWVSPVLHFPASPAAFKGEAHGL